MTEKLIETSVLNEAKSLGFPSHLDRERDWQILPKRRGAAWKLSQAEDSRWILSFKSRPQLYLAASEAIDFLALQARRR